MTKQKSGMTLNKNTLLLTLSLWKILCALLRVEEAVVAEINASALFSKQPPLVEDVKGNDTVLDMRDASSSKTKQVRDLVGSEGVVVVNDVK